MGRFPRRWPGRHRPGRCARHNAVSGWGHRPVSGRRPGTTGAGPNTRSGADETVEAGPGRGVLAPHGAARRRAPGPRVRGRCRWSDRDAKTDGRPFVIRGLPARGTPGDRQSFNQRSGGLAASRVPLGVRLRRGCVPRRPIGQPTSGPQGRGGIRVRGGLFDRSARLRPAPSS